MNESHSHINVSTYEQKKFSLTDFFNSHWDKYVKKPKKFIKKEHYHAVNAIRVCRTEVLGKQIYVCSDCGEISEVFHSCKHRFCPNCSWKDTLNWADKAYQKLLNIPHRHSVATLPHQLNPLLEKNYRLLNNALFKAAAETIKDWFLAKYDITPGIISVLHTFGEKKNRHHHAHMIVSMGGINKKTKELKKVAINFIPYKFLSKKFMIKFQDILVDLFDNKLLKHNFNDKKELLILLKQINKNNWRFHFEPPMKEALKVIKYVGRYSKRACLSESKITDIQGEYISFKYKDNKDRDAENKPIQKILTLHYSDFFPRLLQHVPPKRYQIIRYYGIYANAVQLDENLKVKPEKTEAATAYKNPKFCKYCNKEKILILIVFDLRRRENRTEKFNVNIHKNKQIHLENVA